MKRTIALLVTIALCGNAVAQQQTWVPISKTIDMRAGSFELRTFMGEPIATAIERIKLRDGTISFSRVGITLKDCAQGYGTVWVYDVRTGAFKSSSTYVNDGGTVISEVADALCALGYETITTDTRPAKSRM